MEKPAQKSGKALLIAGLREDHPGNNADIPAQWHRFAPHIGKVPGQKGNVAYGVVLEKQGGFSYLTGIDVSDISALPKDFAHINIPAQDYYVFPHKGHVSTLFETIDAALATAYPNEHAGQARPGEMGFFERYGEGFNPATGLGDMEIWLPLRT